MNWGAFWSGLLGTAIPSAIASLVVLHLGRRFNLSLEQFKADLQRDMVRFSKWHERRIEACSTIYAEFDQFLDFLRIALYVKDSDVAMDPMHSFRKAIKRQIVFLDDVLAEKVLGYEGELMKFWNDAMLVYGPGSKETKQKLDFEIPSYLVRLRRDILDSLDPTKEGDRFAGALLQFLESGKPPQKANPNC